MSVGCDRTIMHLFFQGLYDDRAGPDRTWHRRYQTLRLVFWWGPVHPATARGPAPEILLPLLFRYKFREFDFHFLDSDPSRGHPLPGTGYLLFSGFWSSCDTHDRVFG